MEERGGEVEMARGLERNAGLELNLRDGRRMTQGCFLFLENLPFPHPRFTPFLISLTIGPDLIFEGR